MESLHGLTKGTDLEPMIKQAMLAEANGTMMYYALAHLAKEQGLDEIAETIMKAEYNGEKQVAEWLTKFVRRDLLRRLTKWKFLQSRKVITAKLSKKF